WTSSAATTAAISRAVAPIGRGSKHQVNCRIFCIPITIRLMPTTFHEIPRERPVTPLLDRAETPDGLRRLAESELENLADELRQTLLYSVGQTGGHFGAGLGVVE